MTAPDPTAGEEPREWWEEYTGDRYWLAPACPPAVSASTGTSEDVEGLAAAINSEHGTDAVHRLIAERLLASDWLAARESAARAEAWDEGHRHRQRRGPDECQCAAWSEGECACGRYGTGALVSLADNPYRSEAR